MKSENLCIGVHNVNDNMNYLYEKQKKVRKYQKSLVMKSYKKNGKQRLLSCRMNIKYFAKKAD